MYSINQATVRKDTTKYLQIRYHFTISTMFVGNIFVKNTIRLMNHYSKPFIGTYSCFASIRKIM